jgi:hypothetical protein
VSANDADARQLKSLNSRGAAVVSEMEQAQRENVFCKGVPSRFIRRYGSDSGIEPDRGLKALLWGSWFYD